MRFITSVLAVLISVSLIFTGCNSDEQPQSTFVDPYGNNPTLAEEDYWAKENFDLERVGNLLERSNDPQEFERYINQEDGINNLDLNGDGYVDYISVDEFEDRGSNARGLSLFTRFGPDLIQEIATIFFYRDNLEYPGARILLTGNDQIYGDNHYYETNWLDRSLGLVSFLFTDRDQYYRSPYYYDYYPSDYVVYEVVDTPIYVTRIERLYPEPVLIYTSAAPTYITNLKIKSPHAGHRMDKIHAKLAKPSKEQAEFIKNTPARRGVAKAEKDNKGGGRVDNPATVDKPARDDRPKADRGPESKNPNAGPPAAKPESPAGKPAKADNPGRGQDQAPAKAQDPGKGQGQAQGKDQGGGGKGKKP